MVHVNKKKGIGSRTSLCSDGPHQQVISEVVVETNNNSLFNVDACWCCAVRVNKKTQIPSTVITGYGRTPGNGKGGLFPKKHLSSGQRFHLFVWIAPGLPEIFQKLLSGHPYLAYFLRNFFSRISTIWGKITACILKIWFSSRHLTWPFQKISQICPDLLLAVFNFLKKTVRICVRAPLPLPGVLLWYHWKAPTKSCLKELIL